MLLDRKRINRWTRWFAIVLVVVFALGTVFLGVGSKTGNIFAGCAKGAPSASSKSFEDREAYYKDQISQNPQDNVSMLALANLYADDSVGRYDDAITWFNNALALDPGNADLQLRIASIYMNKTQNYDAAVKLLTDLTAKAPDNANAFLYLGQAAKSAGQNQTAILAWTRYLALAPTSEFAATIKDEITKLSTLPAVTPPPTSTVPGTSGATLPGSPGASLPSTPAQTP
ncbi:MAG: tetratricopeptide repeat protein [Thermoleophilia bacterium]